MPHAAPRRYRIGLLEDNYTTRAMIRRALAPMEVTAVADNLADGAHLDDSVELDAVLLDWHVPDGDGWSLSERLLAAHPQLKVFVYTGDEPPLLRPPRVQWLHKERLHEWGTIIERSLERET